MPTLVNDALALLRALGAQLEARRPRRWHCRRCSPGRTPSRPRAATAPTGDGRSRRARPRTRSPALSTATHGTPAGPAPSARDGHRAHVSSEPETGIITDSRPTETGDSADDTESCARAAAPITPGTRPGPETTGTSPPPALQVPTGNDANALTAEPEPCSSWRTAGPDLQGGQPAHFPATPTRPSGAWCPRRTHHDL